ncbi:hypothetical protein P170DRAFT_358198 [Aspergillus steynii IBT 23096]|uniref:GAR domain-containing protein n=1 Tax=Aspergillus steynii IBT 23096 TaxID=1392250 RepID=A0A2I2G969_9EURO|nr:uncharacterized protein P170DRAFT_358198 [Aspergillus steynii IBT 23096]PLB49398.1 hypothetical protein P170DRAFT_358198 [Aspergillus steynii IBT 23096]
MATSRVSPVRPPVRLTPTDSQAHPIPRTPSPNRRAIPNYQTTDPLLRNLSPESTLKALSSTDAVPKNERAAHDILSKSISQVSQAERALGIRAAIAAQNLSLWYKEVQTWDWPKRTDVHLGKGFVPPSPSDPEYYGSLPAAIVVQHEKRIEEIRDGMDGLDVDELKEHVLNAHIPSRSRPSSSNSTMSVPPPLSYNQLSDFTAVITATILRALPLLSRLNSLLSTWDVRLLVLRQVSGLLRSLSLARSELDAALALLKSPEVPSEADALYSRNNYHAKRAQLEATVLSAGRRMDRMLDALEGREDSLPEDWIDDLEAIESGFGSWVMEAEQRTVANEWQRTLNAKKEEAPATSPSDDSNAEPVLSQPEPICTTGRSLPMETIQEEPGSPLESVFSKANKDDQFPSVSQIDAVLPVTSDSNDAESLVREEASIDPELSAPQTQEAQVANPSIEQEKPTEEFIENDLPTPTKQLQEAPVDAELPKEDPCVPEPPTLNEEKVVLPASEDVRAEETSRNVTDLKESSGLTIGAEQSLPPCESSSNPSPLSGPQKPSDSSEMQKKDESTVLPNPSPEADDLPSPNQVPELIKNDTLDNHNEPGKSSDILDRPIPSIERDEITSPCAPTPQRSSRTPDSVVVKRAPLALSQSASPIPLSPEPSALPENDKDLATNEPDDRSPKQPLESPIKLSKTRPGRLDLDKNKAQLPGRRPSNVSAGSFSETDYPSLISSPEIREPRTGSSNGTPRFLETPPQFQPHYHAPGPAPSNNEHTLREDRLFRLASAKASPRLAVNHNRNLSLPLQRFINERLELDFENDSPVEVDSTAPTPRTASPPVSAAPRNERQATPGRARKGRGSTPTKNAARVSGQPSANSRDGSATPEPAAPMGKVPKIREQNKKAFAKSSNNKVLGTEPAPHQTTTRLRKQLTAHPSLESIGAYKSKPLVEASSNSKPGSRSSTPNSQLRKPKDHLDEKISSILTNLPTRIHLMSAEERETDDVDVMSSLPMKARERFRSVSPTASRSGTPTPSLTLTPAPSRRRYSHAHAPEESSVKLYHLHRGGKSAPTKLFVRSVGEHGERVMVRVGGGWADLAEYLREYAIHHGRRHVSETPRVEVQGLSSRESTPSYSPPGSRLTPAGNGRTTPSRPRSVMSNRPSSSLAVRKTRRGSNVSDMTDFRAVSAGEALNVSVSPKSIVSSRRRLSASSNASFGATSCVSEIRHGSSPSTTVGGSSHSIPLGLAGPKPRSRHVSMTPESEAWVEDVLGQARRSSSLRPFNYGLPPQEQEQPGPKPLSLPKSRSISDLGKAGSSKRVALRGLGNR